MSDIKTELETALLTYDKPSKYFEKLRMQDKLDEYFTEVKALIDVPQNCVHHLEGDAWTHTMLVLDESAKRRKIVKNPFGFMLSALCHDFGKAISTTVSEDGAVHSYRHELESVPLAEKFLKRLDIDSNTTEYVLNMVLLHMEPNIMAGVRSRLKKTNRLFDDSVEPFDLIQLSICDGLGKLPQCADNEGFLMDRYRKYMAIMSRPYMTENDLIEAGITDNGIVPEVLGYAHKLRLAGLNRDEQIRQSLAYARNIMKKAGKNNC